MEKEETKNGDEDIEMIPTSLSSENKNINNSPTSSKTQKKTKKKKRKGQRPKRRK